VIMQDFADKVDELSDGDIEIQVRPYTELYNSQAEIFPNVRNGNIEMGLVAPTFYYTYMPKYVALMSQNWGNNIQERIDCYEAVLEMDEFQTESKDEGVTQLGWVSTGWLEFYFTKEVTDLYTDLNGDDFIVSPGGVVDQLVSQIFHATPIQKNYGEIAGNAEKGTIAGVAVMPFDLYYNLGLYDAKYLPYVKMTRTLDYPFQIQINLSWWNGLDQDQQNILENAWAAVEQDGFDLVESRFNDAYQDLLSKSSVHISEMTVGEPEWLQFHAIVVGLFEGWLKMEFPAEGYSGEAAAAPTAPDSPTVTTIKNIVAGVLS